VQSATYIINQTPRSKNLLLKRRLGRFIERLRASDYKLPAGKKGRKGVKNRESRIYVFDFCIRTPTLDDGEA
jgi:hypothetical protein